MIEIRHLYKAFDNHMVLRNLNMKINEGAVYGFVGPNGAGKTTTMRIIAGLLKADSGQILIDGEDVGVRHKELIGYMPGRHWRKAKGLGFGGLCACEIQP